MKNYDFVTDMALDVLERESLCGLSDKRELQYGIIRRRVELKNAELAKKIGKERGVYLTYDCPRGVAANTRRARALQSYLADALVELGGVMGRRGRILVVGLGNDEVSADSLGARTVRRLAVSSAEVREKGSRGELMACAVGVEGMTGIKSAEAVEGLCMKLKPTAVFIVDALATAEPCRLGSSFQLTTAGIAPGSGVGRDRARIDRTVTGAPVVAVGVPMVLAMPTVLRNFTEEYAAATGGKGDEYKLRSIIAEKRLGGLLVAPKDIVRVVENAALLLAGALNAAYGEKNRTTTFQAF